MNDGPLSYVIIDDDEFSRDTIEMMLSCVPGIRLLKKLADSGNAIKYIYTLKPDFVLLDIDMPGKSGIDILMEINELNIQTKVIFITSHNEFMIKAFKEKAADYLVKPVSTIELFETISRVESGIRQKFHSNTPNESSSKIWFKNSHSLTIFDIHDVLYVEADGCYSFVYTKSSGVEVISKNIGSIESLFPPGTFYRISRSLIINTGFLAKIDRLKRQIILSVDSKQIILKASRERLYDLESFLMRKQNLQT